MGPIVYTSDRHVFHKEKQLSKHAYASFLSVPGAGATVRDGPSVLARAGIHGGGWADRALGVGPERASGESIGRRYRSHEGERSSGIAVT